VIHRPPGMGAFQFVVLATLRAAQLMKGCRPRVERGVHKSTIIAQVEVAEGKVQQLLTPPVDTSDIAGHVGAILEPAVAVADGV
jgi:RNA polymerase Rpb6